MKNHHITAAALAAAFVALPAAAEAPKADAPLWTASPQALPAIDFDTTKPGLELLSIAQSCSVSAPDANGLIAVTRKLKIKVYAADGTTVVMAPTTANVAKTELFPDPRLSRFQCNGANVTNYRASYNGADADDLTQGYGVPVGNGGFNNQCAPHTFEANFALCDEMPSSTFGVTVAKISSSERVVLVSQAMNLSWHNNVANDDMNASGFSITAYAMNGTELWKKSIAGDTSDGYHVIGHLARVGDYLNSDGSDEIRLVYGGGGGLRYKFINPKTGATISTITPVPPQL